MSLPVVILGGGGHAKVLIDALIKNSFMVLGYTDPQPELSGVKNLAIPWLGNDEIIFEYSQQSILLVNGIGSINSTLKRCQLFNRFKEKGYMYTNVIHPSAVIATNVSLQEGVQIMAGVVIEVDSVIGNNSIINTKASINHDCWIGDHVHIAPGVTLSGNVRVGESSHIGAGATIIQNLNIGRNCLIGAGAVVVNDIPDNAVVMGVPGNIVRYQK